MVFVTGATGLLGSHLLYFLAASGHQVMALKRKDSCVEDCRAVFLQYTEHLDWWERITWVEGDVLKAESIQRCVKEADCVYHCAAIVSFNGPDKDKLIETNLKGSRNMAELCLNYQVRLCYVSSIAALGDAKYPGEFIHEDTPDVPGSEHSVYSHSKGDAEKIIRQYMDVGLDAVIVNPSIILGGGMWGRSSTRLFITAARGLIFYTKGVSGYVDVRDVCRLMIRLAEDKKVRGERFVLNGGNYSYKELFTEIAIAMEHRLPFFYMAPWITGLAWRLLAVIGWIMGKAPLFTRETARTAHHKSYYSSGKLLALYPDFHFHSLQETVSDIAAWYASDCLKK